MLWLGLTALLLAIVVFAIAWSKRGVAHTPHESEPATGRRMDGDSVSPGTKLGPYEILSLLGKGGMGEVYRARDSRLDRDVAIKILPERLSTNSERLQRFEQEAKALASLSHPNILAIHDVGRESGISYLVTELLTGKTLRDRLDDGAMSREEAVALATQMAQGLTAAHESGIIHRDLKPENVHLTDEGRVKILDFGLAKHEDSDEGLGGDTEAQTQSRLTSPGAVVGTMGYMAPEQLRGHRADTRSDVFALGAMLFEMLTGTRAFFETELQSTLRAATATDHGSATDDDDGVSSGLGTIVARCLERDPDNRIQSAEELRASLATLAAATGVSGITAQAAPQASGVPSIAVLPFTDMSPGHDQDYFCEGMAEEILGLLSKSNELRVVARTSAFRYKGQSVDLRLVGRELGVGVVLEGSVRTSGDRLRVTANLVSTSDGLHLWTEKYDRRDADVFTVQDDIAGRIVDSLKVKLTDTSASSRRTKDLNAYHLYLKARFHVSKRNEEGLSRGIRYAQQAIQADESYAPAHACLADCWLLFGFQGAVRPEDALPKAAASARRALELDESLSDAHNSLGCAYATYEWSFADAAREFERAIELNPANAQAHYWYAIWNLVPTGRFQEAEREIARARELDPLALVLNAGMGWQFYFVGEYERAIEEAKRASDIDEDFVMAHDVAALGCVQLGRYREAIGYAQRAVTLSYGRSLSLGILGHANARLGDTAAAHKALDYMVDARTQSYVSAYDIALVHAGLDEAERALSWLETACDERNGWLVFLDVEPRFESLRGHPKFVELKRRVGLTE